MTARRIFWFLLALVLAAVFHYRQVGFDMVNLGYKFGLLHITKQKVLEIRVEQDIIGIYVEPYPRPVTLRQASQLGIILKEAYWDYYIFLKKHYPQLFYSYRGDWHKTGENLDFIFISDTTYEALDRMMKQHNSNAAYLVFFNTVYFKTYDDTYKILEMRTTIRHEIFHYLNNYYGLTADFEETAAQTF